MTQFQLCVILLPRGTATGQIVTHCSRQSSCCLRQSEHAMMIIGRRCASLLVCHKERDRAEASQSMMARPEHGLCASMLLLWTADTSCCWMR